MNDYTLTITTGSGREIKKIGKDFTDVIRQCESEKDIYYDNSSLSINGIPISTNSGDNIWVKDCFNPQF